MPTPKKAAAPKNALSKPVQPDAALAAVVGKDPLPRTELTKKLWEYIRKHELQDPKEKRNIRADERLLAVFDGKKVVSMFEMTKLVNGHLVCFRQTNPPSRASAFLMHCRHDRERSSKRWEAA
jgi:chromatin remodeling complex protein RSC6